MTMTDGVSTYNVFPPGWSTTPLATYVYSYDNANRVSTETDAEGTYSLHVRQCQRIDRRDRERHPSRGRTPTTSTATGPAPATARPS